MTDSPLPVICDRCRIEGQAGADPFLSFGDLLDFQPVPRRTRRADGWDGEVQRAFIAALSLTGSIRAAARAVGKATFGVDQLLACPDSHGFAQAMDDAFAIAADERSRRLAEGLRTVAAEQAGWRPPPAPWSHAASRGGAPHVEDQAEDQAADWIALPEDPDEQYAARAEMLDRTLVNYTHRIALERKARLAGDIVAADFYMRQATHLEVMLDLACAGGGGSGADDGGAGGGGFAALMDFMDRHPNIHAIAATPMSRLLGRLRRAKWAEMGDPPRPAELPDHYLVHKEDGTATAPLESTRGGQPLSHQEQQAIFDARHKTEALKQLEWEAEARRDYEARREASQPMDEEPGLACPEPVEGAGQPRSSED